MHHALRLDRRTLLAGLAFAATARIAAAQNDDPNKLFNDGVNLLFAGKPKESAEAFDDEYGDDGSSGVVSVKRPVGPSEP